MMKLHSSGTSPFARKVRVAIVELGLGDQVEEMMVAGTPVNTGTMPLSHNPLGKLPALEREDGPALYDSRVITRYLNDRADGALYPDRSLWEVLTLEATADGIMEAAILMVYEDKLRPTEAKFPEWVEGQWGKVSRALDHLEDRWISHLEGPLHMGQVAVGCALEYLDLRCDDRNWRATRPELAKWQAKFGARETMISTQPVG